MLINNKAFQSIWINEALDSVMIIDQRYLPHQLQIVKLNSVDEVYHAIRDMLVRGAPLIGVTAAFGLYFACMESVESDDADTVIRKAAEKIKSSRPTAVDLFKSVDTMTKAVLAETHTQKRAGLSKKFAVDMMNASVEACRAIGEYGLEIIEKMYRQKGECVNILTHCNAGWLATVDYGTATAPIYLAHQKGIPLHVWVDETRPRNQGAALTAFELQQQGINCTLICDNTGGHLMQKGMVDMVIVGADRVTKSGDAANKIGTYLKALAANDNSIPFYVAVPSSSIDFSISDGLREINIEERDEDEVKYVTGWEGGQYHKVLICPEATKALNIGFDVTPARFISGIITERGVCDASEEALRKLFPEEY